MTPWGAPTLPAFNSAPAIPLNAVPVIHFESPYSNPVVSNSLSVVNDNGGHSVTLSIPSYSVPITVASPSPLPLSLDPVAALPSKDSPLPPNQALKSSPSLKSSSPLASAPVGTQSGVLIRQPLLSQSPLLAQSPMSVQAWNVQAWQRDPVLSN
ncbi:hypothetical protein REC12_15465 [Desulfosporosinus sp. PR]|uniref:hypothetical protein n=1 Tax=Candidatus Desulfosporosinus nitrosoreducens TaxID=3401928 RepID=UPI0027F04E7A|nr:hypothetical protein [Desulfosporosinus sp. PR]MDQ7094994.1 hypothetical protein [Desulfosporosinus sp. PR]